MINNDLEIDELSMYLGYDYQVTDKIIVHQPTIKEIAEFGEQRYYSSVFTLTAIPSDLKVKLEDMGFNYMNIKDYELFMFLSKSLTKESTSILLGDVDLSKMEPAKDETNGEIILIDPETGVRIDKFVYEKMVRYIRKIHGIVPKIQNAANETTRQILIKLDREKEAKQAKEGHKSTLKPVISGLMRAPSCTLSFEEILNLPIYTAMDTISGIQVFISSTALLTGSYSGMVDTSKINKKEFDWMRDIHEEKKTPPVKTSSDSNNKTMPTAMKA